MRSSKKTGFFVKANEYLNLNLQTLRILLLEKNYQEAKIMLAADPELYDIKGSELTDANGYHFPKISLFTYMLWKNDIDGINVFLHACSEMTSANQYNALNMLKLALEKFKKSGTVVIVESVKHKHHHGLVLNNVEVNLKDLITQVSERMEILRKEIVEKITQKLL